EGRGHRRQGVGVAPRTGGIVPASAGWARPVGAGRAARLGGQIVVLEPLSSGHEDGLYEAARDMDWSWMFVDAGKSREAFARYFEAALPTAAAGVEAPFPTLDAQTGEPIGSTRFLTLRPEHRGLEIGWTWVRRSRWQSGANVEAKLLQLTHAFETHGCMRVEFKTDAKNKRSRRAMEALPAQVEGLLRNHMLGGDARDRLRDSAFYAIVDDDWPAVKANLLRRLGRGRRSAKGSFSSRARAGRSTSSSSGRRRPCSSTPERRTSAGRSWTS